LNPTGRLPDAWILATIRGMEVAAAFTVWLTFGAWLFLPTVRAPAMFSRVAIGLCAAELLAVAIWCFGTEECTARPCAPVPETARMAAALDIPALTGLSFVLALLSALRASRAC
jgi:hypothetical protein